MNDETAQPAARALGARRCACFDLRKAARAVTRMYDDALRPAGVRGTQFNLMMILRIQGPIPMSDLAQIAVMDRTTLTRNLKLLERDGRVRSAPGEDRRIREVSLTESGERTLERAYPLWDEVQGRIEQILGSERLAGMLDDLQLTVEGVHS